jgi:general secretion pathway protein C
MLDTRTHDWLARLQSNGPNTVSIALAVLIAVEFARMAVALVGGHVKTPEPVIAPSAEVHQRPAANLQTIVSAHLFGTAVADPAAQDPNNAPLSSANLVLAGTIATQDPKRGIAIISDGGPSKVFSIGDNVNGASLYSVYLDHVILDRGGTLETLLLPRLIAGTRASPRMSRRMGPDPRTAEAVESVRRLVQQDPGILDQVMRTVPSYDNAAGKMRGFRAYPGRNRAIFSKLGLQSGDLVTAINGEPLDDPQHSQEVFNTIQSSNTVAVTIERAGQKQDITLNIAQVAAEATRDLEGDNPAAARAGFPGGSAAQVPAPPAAPPPGPAPPTPEAPNE